MEGPRPTIMGVRAALYCGACYENDDKQISQRLDRLQSFTKMHCFSKIQRFGAMGRFFRQGCALWLIAALGASPSVARAQTVPPTAILLHHDAVKNAEAARFGRQLFLSPMGLTADNYEQPGEASMPRFAASLVSVEWLGHAADENLSLAVEQDYWIARWTKRPATASVIVLTFDFPPQLLSELEPIKASGDGSIFLPACLASTAGEKIRYEPQTFKNTVGYWTGKQDSCEWRFNAARTGTYNVAVLQGCGSGNGGSRVKLSLPSSTGTMPIEFEVLETGHFQNFQWRHLGTLQIENSGVHSLKVEPIQIKNVALGDIRAIHLIPIPQ